jgi:hypothetical protein
MTDLHTGKAFFGPAGQWFWSIDSPHEGFGGSRRMFFKRGVKHGPNTRRDFGGLWVGPVVAGLAVLLAVWPTPSAAEGPVTQIIEAEAAVLQQGRESQGRIDAMDEETARLVHEYRDMERHHEQVAVYNDYLSQMIAFQVSELASLERQIGQTEVTQREIVPLMLRMLEALEGFSSRSSARETRSSWPGASPRPW